MLKYFLMIMILLCGFDTPAKAQDVSVGRIDERTGQRERNQREPAFNKYDPKYRPGSQPTADGKALLSNSSFLISLIRPAKHGSGKFAVRISQPVAINGCANIVMPPAEIRRDGPMMWVNVKTPEVSVDASSSGACAAPAKPVHQDIPFTRAQINETGLETIVFKNDFGQDAYGINVDENAATLSPRSSNLFKPMRSNVRKDALKYTFMPANTLILSAPMAKKDVTADMEALARKHGLVPMRKWKSGFESPLQDADSYYFYDKNGKTARALREAKSMILGHITVTEVLQGPQGRYNNDVILDVMVRTPGVYE